MDGLLEVEAFRALEDGVPLVVITVRDNGVGCDLSSLQEKEHIGVGNVRRRFKYAYPNGAFNMRSAVGRGTEVRMTFDEMYHS
jgi:signal transduction histidine kinase